MLDYQNHLKQRRNVNDTEPSEITTAIPRSLSDGTNEGGEYFAQ